MKNFPKPLSSIILLAAKSTSPAFTPLADLSLAAEFANLTDSKASNNFESMFLPVPNVLVISEK